MPKVRKWLWWGLGGAGALYIFSKLMRPSGFPGFIKRKKVTHSTRDGQGYVVQSPKELAAQVGTDVETYSLARVVGSEHDSGNFIEKVSIAWAVRNAARAKGWSITKRLNYVTDIGDTGRYGTQEQGRAFSTARDPTDADLYVATQVLAGAASDPTGGATKFFDPTSQARKHEQWLKTGEKPRYRSAEELIAKWESDGNVRIANIPGVDAADLIFFRPRRA